MTYPKKIKSSKLPKLLEQRLLNLEPGSGNLSLPDFMGGWRLLRSITVPLRPRKRLLGRLTALPTHVCMTTYQNAPKESAIQCTNN